ncbi:hypothetical protein PLESTB_001794100 [Pleodorina starrii]|uniref:Starch synthase, chloroplastic/amyloplastic n=1 Tax=Pleodorina starrii TaxID=330485 RepID=A0A9W6C1H0_9CHLO|nr:hypothetical protein PLESTM_001158400 [Pleodorina starrii]GLC61705.1 hypothetical protein PLESTB_001794100 [Pleodorina starrii]GLC69184.1 hypothetical protein PLESTF_000799700 [Pleodorina starrii]
MQALGSRVAAPARQAEQRMAAASTSRPSVRPIVINASAFGVKKTANQLLRELARGGASGRRTARSAVTGATGATCALDIVFVAAEVAPWSKTGGLGDVTGGLPIELVKRGHRVMTIAPRYDQYADAWDTSVVVDVMGEKVRFFHSIKQGVHRVWVDHPWFLAKVWGKTGSKLYGPRSGADYLDNHKRFSLFCRAAIEAVRALPFGPGEDCVFVANDWHSALVPLMLKEVYQPKGEFTKAKSVLAIHNIAFQGRMWEDTFKDMGLPTSAYDKFAFTDGYSKVYTEATPMEEDEKPPLTGKTYKKINWLKAGILTADKLVTVSPNYATEISADAAGGVELDTAIRSRGGIEGIVNGMDIEEWNPKTDKFLALPYDQNSVYAGKAAAKEALQAELGLPVDPTAPLFAFIGRLEEQKGVDIILAALPKLLATPKVQIAILGTGKAAYEKMVNAIGAKYKGRAKGVVKFSAPLAHMMTAGADFMLVPSRFEPCGLIQLHAMHYGTVPVVASTGGLVDTVKEGVTGFHMGALNPEKLDEADADAMAATVRRAAEVFATPRYAEMVYNCISQDLSWSRPAQKWEGLLEELVFGAGPGTVQTAKKLEVKVPVQEKIPGDFPAVARASNVRPAAAEGAAAPAAAKAAPSAPPMGAWRATTPAGPVTNVPKVTTYKAVSAAPAVKPLTAVKPASGNGNGAVAPAAAKPAAAAKESENGNGNGVAAPTPSVVKTASRGSLVSASKSA